MNTEMKNIPIREAMIAWTEVDDSRKTRLSAIKVLHHTDPGNETPSGWSTDGACWAHWGLGNTKQLMARLLRIGWEVVCRDGLTPEEVHDAFMAIPEYREYAKSEGLFWRKGDCAKTE